MSVKMIGHKKALDLRGLFNRYGLVLDRARVGLLFIKQV